MPKLPAKRAAARKSTAKRKPAKRAAPRKSDLKRAKIAKRAAEIVAEAGERGRPTLYSPELCAALVAYMRRGFSATAFAGSLGVSRATLDLWAAANPDFHAAMEAGKAAQMQFWEGRATNIATAGEKPGAAPMVGFALRNLHQSDWRPPSRVELEHSSGGMPLQTAPPVAVTIIQAPAGMMVGDDGKLRPPSPALMEIAREMVRDGLIDAETYGIDLPVERDDALDAGGEVLDV